MMQNYEFLLLIFRVKNILPAIISCLLCIGCSAILSPISTPKITLYNIDMAYSMPQQCFSSKSSLVFYVSPMEANAPYHDNNMYYSLYSQQIVPFNYNKWSSTIDVLLTQSLQDIINNSNNCANIVVINPNNIVNAQYQLNTRLLTIKEVINSHGTSTVKLAIAAQLVELSGNAIVASRIWDMNTASDIGAPSMAAAIQYLLIKQFSPELISWLKQHTAHS